MKYLYHLIPTNGDVRFFSRSGNIVVYLYIYTVLIGIPMIISLSFCSIMSTRGIFEWWFCLCWASRYYIVDGMIVLD